MAASPRSAAVPDPVDTELAGESLAPEVFEPEKVKKKGKKRAASGPSVSSIEGVSAELKSDEHPKKKTKKKKKKKKPVEEQTELDEVVEGWEMVVHDGSGHDTTARTEGGWSGLPVVPLERKKRKKQSVDCDAPASTK